MISSKEKDAIARVLVGAERGTGFLVSRAGDVLTALHCVAMPDSFDTATPEPRPGKIKLRFGDPRGTTFETAATLVAWSAQHDVAVLRCENVPSCDPLELGPLAYGITRWKTFGFPAASGAVEAGGNEVWGQVCDGTIATATPNLQLTLDQIVNVDTNLSGISGAPIIAGGIVVGIARQELRADKTIVQNSLFGTPLGAFAPRLGLQAADAELRGEKHLVALINDIQPVALRLSAPLLGLSEDPDGLGNRTTRKLLTAPLRLAVKALTDHLQTCLDFAPMANVALLLCSARIPDAVLEQAAPVLRPITAPTTPPACVHVGAQETATARSFTFHFAIEQSGLRVVHRSMVVLGPLPGEEDAAMALKKRFRSQLAGLMECLPEKVDKIKAAWLNSGRRVYVVAEAGSGDDIAAVLREEYPLVFVVVREAPSEREATAHAIPRIVDAGLEEEFNEALLMLE